MNGAWRIVVLAAIWVVWMLGFLVLCPRRRTKAVQKDTIARWGIALQAAGFAAVYSHSPVAWQQSVAVWRVALGIALAIPGLLLVWTALPKLGRHWRVDAGLNADHELIRTGPYRIIRHPIYAAMMFMFLMSIAIDGTLPGAAIGFVLFFLGIEIRVRTEDALLSERFGEQFRAWRRSVPAYLPLLR